VVAGVSVTAGEEDGLQGPVARIDASAVAGIAPLSIRFGGQGSGSPFGRITDYVWDFGDGGTADVVEVYHTYVDPGLYSAQLTVADSVGELGASELDIAVLPAFAIEQISTANPLSVRLVAATVSGIVDIPSGMDYVWDFGDGSVGKGKEVTHTFARPGVYTVTLSLTLALLTVDCATTEVSTVSGGQVSNLVADAGDDQTVNGGELVTLDGSGSSGSPEMKYGWTQTSGSSVDLDNPHALQPRFVAPSVSNDTDLVFTLQVS
ncbi:unnamed protein product, partial [marine sediment metagenome]